MNTVMTIAKDELRYWQRSQVIQITFFILVILSITATVVSGRQLAILASQQSSQQAEANAALLAQPDRHPHRMVHYGHYVYRTPSTLASIDPGVMPYMGNAIFLEGHRQNTTTFAQARETGILARFGALSPAFSLQVLIPLLLILCGYSLIVREREQGTLRQLIAHGVDGWQLLLGKSVALFITAGITLLPMLTFGLISIIGSAETAVELLLIVLSYGVYLGFWVCLTVAVSAWSRSGAMAMVALLGIWSTVSVLVPRISTHVADFLYHAPSQVESNLLIAEALHTAGDGHNANDPAFADLRANTLEQYGVERVEDLPFNYLGLVSLLAEENDSGIINTYAGQKRALERKQSGVMKAFSILSPMLAVKNFSMELAETGLASHHRFLEAAEEYRFNMVQHYNRLHMSELQYESDAARSRDPDAEQRNRISAENWAALPDFFLASEPLTARMGRAWPSLAILCFWLLLTYSALHIAARRITQ